MSVRAKVFASFYGLGTLLVAVFLAWLLLANTNYLYGVWHDHGGIGAAIDKYGPQNRYRDGFENTNREQRIALFAKIVNAVHNGGEGLERIFYVTPDNAPGTPLLREPEITHLKDVANLIAVLSIALGAVAALWLLVTVWKYYRREALPPALTQVAGFGIILLVLLLLISLFGWESLFNQLHIWIFPEEHQWFFYYQDSLMSTMMWAPHLFTYIGLSWLAITILFFFGLLYFQYLTNSRLPARSEGPKHRG